ncbi:MAG: 30S ribosomal protein S24e [Methanoculleaceae archaeon]
MEISFIKDEMNELLDRREIEIEITYDDATPSRQEVIGKVASLLDVKPECLVLDSIRTRFGSKEAVAEVRVYEDEETRNRIECDYLLRRGMKKEEGEAEA